MGVADGDTLTILDADNRQHKVRLDSIDAPESKQAFGQRSRQSLANICAGKMAEVAEQGKDRYGRTIGRVSCAQVDANSERGMAWVYDRYAKQDSPLYALQWEAQGIKRGLWLDPRAVAPWEWRASGKKRPRRSVVVQEWSWWVLDARRRPHPNLRAVQDRPGQDVVRCAACGCYWMLLPKVDARVGSS